MRRDKWAAVAVGGCGAWLSLIVCACTCAILGHVVVGRVLGLASLPWLALFLYADGRSGRRR